MHVAGFVQRVHVYCELLELSEMYSVYMYILAWGPLWAGSMLLWVGSRENNLEATSCDLILNSVSPFGMESTMYSI